VDELLVAPSADTKQLLWQVHSAATDEWLLLPRELHHEWFMSFANYKKQLFYAQTDVTTAQEAVSRGEEGADQLLARAQQVLTNLPGKHVKSIMARISEQASCKSFELSQNQHA
jgi:hypothetical protein